jgi:hypothetical protein
MMLLIRKQLLRRLTVCTAVFSFALALNAQTTAWKTYSYPEDGFSISYPTEPSVQKNYVPTAAGTFELRAYISEVGEAALYVGVCDYGTAVAGRTPESVLSGAQQGAIDNVKAHLISSKAITLGTYPGIAFEAESDSMHFSARIFLVGSALYQNLVASPILSQYPDSTRFMDSFQLIARVKP